MAVTVELTYDMSKVLGVPRFTVEGARTVQDVVRLARERFGERGAAFEQLTRVASVVVNGVLVGYRGGMGAPVADGDTVGFVKAAAGG